MHLYKARFNHLMISIIGNSSKKIHQVICNWIGYHFYDAAPWNLTKSDGRLNSYLKDEEASKRKKSSDSTETMSYLCVCVWASVSATGHNCQDLTWSGCWVMGISKDKLGEWVLDLHICAKSTNAKLHWVLREHIKILCFVLLFENKVSLCTGESLGGPLQLDTDCVTVAGYRTRHRGKVEKGEAESSL